MIVEGKYVEDYYHTCFPRARNKMDVGIKLIYTKLEKTFEPVSEM